MECLLLAKGQNNVQKNSLHNISSKETAISILFAALVAAAISQQSGPLADNSSIHISSFELSPCNKHNLNCLVLADSDLVELLPDRSIFAPVFGVPTAVTNPRGAISQTVAVIPYRSYRYPLLCRVIRSLNARAPSLKLCT
eukprot:TRINITY_DN1506_c0_g2_i3.p1 TRINITY_DN1506_c0_g2~~TRINITY_DN1506_c0_g2_i3.p1  ORF type:complete len:141 (-),score=9.95 TRINITY_DN1506_c0_g2_i3:30-452(-)